MLALRELVNDWCHHRPRPLQATAASKDFQALFVLAPVNPRNLCSTGASQYPRLARLTELASELKGLLRAAAQVLRPHLRGHNLVVSPYVGGAQPQQMSRPQ